MPIRLTTLGAARVHRGDTGYPDLPAQRLRFALLLYLAVEQDVSRDEVVTMFWPDRDTARGKHALRQMLYELRQVLGEQWIELRRDRIVATATVDAIEFERAVEAGRTAEALALYGGPFLLGFSLDNRSFEAWTDRRSAHLARLHRRLQREHIAQFVTAGQLDEALAAARNWVELDPLDDEAAHTLIERLIAAGQRTAALQFYDRYERQLAAELQVEPLDETRALIASLRNGAAALAGLRPAVPETAGTSAGNEPAARRQTAAELAADSTPGTSASAPSPGQQAVSRSPDRRSAATPPRRTAREILRSSTVLQRAAVLLVVAIGTFTAAMLARPSARQASLPTHPSASIAVLPFNDHSSDASLGWIAGALTEALAHGLARSHVLSVISPNGVRQLREQGVPEDTLGRMLGADYLVGGSVFRDGDQIRMNVELLDSRSGEVVRSQEFKRPFSESRNFVEDVVSAAAVFLRAEVGTRIEIERTQAGASVDDALRLVREAKEVQEAVLTLLHAGQFPTALESLAEADSLLALAATLDPRWPEPVLRRGYVAERRAFVLRMQGRSPRDLQTELEAGLAHAESAERIGKDSAGVHALRGALLHQLALQRTDQADSVLIGLAAAEKELRRATDLDPFDQNTWRRLADLLHVVGRYGEANVAAQKAYALDPYSQEAAGLTYKLFNTSLEMGRDKEAEGWCFQGRKEFPDEVIFVYCLLSLHAWATGIDPEPDLLRKEMSKLQASDRFNQPYLVGRFESMIAAAYARAGQADSARAILRRVAAGPPDTGNLWLRAGAHAALGEDSVALALLDEFSATGFWGAPRIVVSRPFWDLAARTDIEGRLNVQGGRP